MAREAIVMPDGDMLCQALFDNPARREALERLGGARIYTDAPLQSAQQYLDRCGDARAVIFGWPLPSEVLALPQLEIVTFMGTGAANHVDLDAARRHSVVVCNAPNYGDTAVAEHAVALAMASLRSISTYDRAMHEGRWIESVPAREIFGSTVGIVGFGGIGAHAARLFAAMGAKVLVWTRDSAKYRAANPQFEFVELEALMRSSDVVSLHLALNESTRRIISAPLLDLLKPGALLVNTARSQIVDEAHLVKLLSSERIRAAIDVFEPEPLPAENPYRNLKGALLTPHVAFNTPQAMERMADITIRNLQEHFAGRSQNRVD